MHKLLQDFRRGEQPQMAVSSLGKEILSRVLQQMRTTNRVHEDIGIDKYHGI